MSGIVAIIPARGGSKGIPRKNLKLLAGRPLIAWTISAAIESAVLDRVIVSSDDPEIRAVAIRLGAEAPFARPAAIATDEASSVDVGLHLLDQLAARNEAEPTTLLQLQPTSPLRTKEDIREICARQREQAAPAVVSVRPAAHPPQWLRRIGTGQELLPWDNSTELHRRQDAETAYELNGALYAVDVAIFRAERTYFPRGTLAFVMPPERSLDIDTPWDFRLAEMILSNKPPGPNERGN